MACTVAISYDFDFNFSLKKRAMPIGICSICLNGYAYHYAYIFCLNDCMYGCGYISCLNGYANGYDYIFYLNCYLYGDIFCLMAMSMFKAISSK
jgi:hypothetical protein